MSEKIGDCLQSAELKEVQKLMLSSTQTFKGLKPEGAPPSNISEKEFQCKAKVSGLKDMKLSQVQEKPKAKLEDDIRESETEAKLIKEEKVSEEISIHGNLSLNLNSV